MTNATPPGWYPDNLDAARVRWWDGSGWTDQTQLKREPDQQAQAQPQGYPQAYPRSSTPAQSPAQSTPRPNPPGIPGPNAVGSAAVAAQLPFAQRQASDPYAARANDPYAQQAKGQQPAPQQGQLPGALQRFNDSIAYGYGDQSYGGHTNGPTDGRRASGGRNVFTEPVLIVSQKRKIIEVTNEYAVYAQDGSQLGAVVEVGQSGMKKAVRLLTSYDQFLTHRLEVRDNDGQVLLRLTRPAKVVKSSIIVESPDGHEIGRLVQQNVFGKIRFGLLAGGTEVGSLSAENWRAWNFALKDVSGVEVARVTKTWEGVLTTMFTTADNYVVHLHQDMPDPLRSLCIAAALTVDTALKQDNR